jgi:predicted O-methyltransferase YrrM
MSVEQPEAPPIETRVKQFDISLFDEIPSQTSSDDRRSILAIQSAVATRLGSFTYLEIGSHLGGSIQPFLLDPRCGRIVSIDKRPKTLPDERGVSQIYLQNSTERMLGNLRRIANDELPKITTFDADSSELNATQIASKVDLCFIDGEHTNLAAEKDFAFCISVLASSGVIFFHDAHIVFQALDNILRDLRAANRPFQAYNLPTSIFVIDFGVGIHEDGGIKSLLLKNHLGYLEGLKSMAHYRQFYNHRFVRMMRRVYRQVTPKLLHRKA